ncbi:hypothetical protein J6590_016440 [Homalodisca vitripennis]|nr:hypothetical protein J6590_016440 [Homalodisca vitripennis]
MAATAPGHAMSDGLVMLSSCALFCCLKRKSSLVTTDEPELLAHSLCGLPEPLRPRFSRLPESQLSLDLLRLCPQISSVSLSRAVRPTPSSSISDFDLFVRYSLSITSVVFHSGSATGSSTLISANDFLRP